MICWPQGIPCVAILALGANTAFAQEPALDTDTLVGAFPGRSYPCANWAFPDRLLWGDTHLHTAISFDSGGLS